MGETLTILGVDHNEECRTLYRAWLGADHDVETAPDGATALELLDASTDLVLLGRELEDANGRDVAREIDDQTSDCHVVMVSNTGADFDIVDYPIDSYVKKPVDGEDLDGIIDQYRRQQDYQSSFEEYFRLTSKLGAIVTELSEDELAESDRYDRLQQRVEEKRKEVDETISKQDTDWNLAFKSCARAAELNGIAGA